MALKVVNATSGHKGALFALDVFKPKPQASQLYSPQDLFEFLFLHFSDFFFRSLDQSRVRDTVTDQQWQKTLSQVPQ